MTTRITQFLVACMLLLSTAACQQAAYPTLPKTTAYHGPVRRVSPVSSFAQVAPKANNSPLLPFLAVQKLVKPLDGIAAKSPQKSTSKKQVQSAPSRQAPGQAQALKQLINKPLVASQFIRKPKQNIASVKSSQEMSMGAAILLVIIVVLVLTIGGGVGVFLFNPFLLKVISGFLAFFGLWIILKFTQAI